MLSTVRRTQQNRVIAERDQVIRRQGASRLAVAAATTWMLLTVGTGIAYVLPLSQHTTDLVSNLSFGVAGLLIVPTLVRAISLVGGIDRLGWAMLLASFFTLLIVFALDPAASNGPPTVALGVAPFVGLSLVVVVLVFGRQGMNRLGLVRLVVDGLWLTAGLVVASWHWAFAPLMELRGSSLLAASFPATIALSSASTMLLWPRVAGRMRLAFAGLGLGTAVTAVAGVIHIRLAHAGTLQFGTWYDFLWMVGLSMLGLSALEPAIGSSLRSRRPSARSEQVITGLPVLGLIIPVLDGEAWSATPPAVTIFMIIVLAIRVVVLISQNHDLSTRLTELAHHDELTGLLNRRALLGLLENEDEDRVRAVLYLDLDGFKQVNDTWGHAAGDHVLAVTADRLQAAVRPGDVVARLGGDEFVVVVNTGDGKEMADRLLVAVSAPIDWARHQLTVGCSIGVADRATAITSDLLACADAALYRSKVGGRNRVSLSSPMDVVSPVR